MFLLGRLDLIALIGLFVQTFLAWAFVAVLATLRRREHASNALDSFYSGFVALAVGLTLLSARFFRSHDAEAPSEVWVDGAYVPTVLYMAYGGLKAWFGLCLVRGSHLLQGLAVPRWVESVGPAMVLGLLGAPMLVPDVTPLLIVQAPVMLVCAASALRPLWRAPSAGQGVRVMRAALIGLGATWSLHAVSAALVRWVPAAYVSLALNSFLDLAVQLTLGTGLVIGVVEESYRRWRAADLERERLQRVLERDERLRALGTLVSGVAHELNNPLTVILGYAELLVRRGDEARHAKVIGEQAERCRGIVRNLSALAGQTVHPLQELSASELVQRVLRGFETDRGPQAPRVRVDDLSGLTLVADRVGMEQVLTNLISNAIAVSPPQGCVTISGRRTADGQELTVADEGPGVSAELRERLFEPFFTTKGPGQGSGLGLAIAHAIVRAHHGRISVEDAPGGRGALFRLHIPHATVAGKANSEPHDAGPPGLLMVVDDDAAVRSVVRLQAELRGWSVAEADSAESALASIDVLTNADAVLCDLRMPGIGGAGLHDRLVEQRADGLERVFFFTGDLASPEAVRFSQRCRRPLVQKPFQFDELFRLFARSRRALLR